MIYRSKFQRMDCSLTWSYTEATLWCDSVIIVIKAINFKSRLFFNDNVSFWTRARSSSLGDNFWIRLTALQLLCYCHFKRSRKTMVSVLHANLISCWVGFLLSCFYRVSQKFVPLISCPINLIKTLFLHEISRRCLLFYRVHVFGISVTSFPLCFLITFRSCCGMEWDTECRATDNLFWAFFTPGMQEPLLHFNPPKQHLGSWKKYTLSIHPKKDNHPSPYPE